MTCLATQEASGGQARDQQGCASCKRPILACRWVKVRILGEGQELKKKSQGLSLGKMERTSKRVHPGNSKSQGPSCTSVDPAMRPLPSRSPGGDQGQEEPLRSRLCVPWHQDFRNALFSQLSEQRIKGFISRVPGKDQTPSKY